LKRNKGELTPIKNPKLLPGLRVPGRWQTPIKPEMLHGRLALGIKSSRNNKWRHRKAVAAFVKHLANP
jgi:hypothetical protein